MKKRICIALILIFILVVDCIQPLMVARANEIIIEETENNSASEEKEFSSNSLIIETSKIDEIKKDSAVENILEIAQDVYIVDYIDVKLAKEKYENLLNEDYIEEVFEDVEISVLDTDASTLAVNPKYVSWGVESTGMDHYTDYLNYKDKEEILVAVLDTGINQKHEVFAKQTTGDRINTTYSYNYVSDSVNVEDDFGHGTNVASVIAESTPDNVKVVPIKVADDTGNGKMSDVIKAIVELKDTVDIINLSVGTENTKLNPTLKVEYEETLKNIYNNGNGPTIVCAAGNAGSSDVFYPASSNYTIAVSALKKDINGNLTFSDSFSNYGNEVDFSAPGEEVILANYKNNRGYVIKSGTSFAAPYISSAVALLKTEFTLDTVDAVKDKLKENVDDLGDEGKDIYYGYGSINFASSKFEVPAIASIIPKLESNKIVVNAVCDDNIVKYACVDAREDIADSDWVDIANSSTNVEIPFNINESGKYEIYIMDSEGQITSKKINVDITNNTVSEILETAVKYSTHVENIGWQGEVSNGELAGTTGQALRLEGIKIYIQNSDLSGSISYNTHIQNIGWQGFVNDGELSGTTERALRLEAIQIKLTGEISNEYDVYYRVHCENIGWMGWAKNGESAGSAGFCYRLEGIQIKLVAKGKDAPGSTQNRFKQNIFYSTHVENVGWQGYVNDGELSGTTGRALRLEGIKIKIKDVEELGHIEYSTHVQDIGWQDYVKNDELAGTTGQALRLEAIRIRLTDQLESEYDVYYRVHCENEGWMDWVKNDELAGTVGKCYRLEAIQIVLVNKGDDAP